jgi:hypothetical protein
LKGTVMKFRTLAILLGWLLLGSVAAAFAATGDVPPRPLTDQGLTNLTALTRLIGYVRFFHPSDQAAGPLAALWTRGQEPSSASSSTSIDSPTCG